jgi:hypothetical protein
MRPSMVVSSVVPVVVMGHLCMGTGVVPQDYDFAGELAKAGCFSARRHHSGPLLHLGGQKEA